MQAFQVLYIHLEEHLRKSGTLATLARRQGSKGGEGLRFLVFRVSLSAANWVNVSIFNSPCVSSLPEQKAEQFPCPGFSRFENIPSIPILRILCFFFIAIDAGFFFFFCPPCIFLKYFPFIKVICIVCVVSHYRCFVLF